MEEVTLYDNALDLAEQHAWQAEADLHEPEATRNKSIAMSRMWALIALAAANDLAPPSYPHRRQVDDVATLDDYL